MIKLSVDEQEAVRMSFKLHEFQTTIKTDVTIVGHGVHSGEKVTLNICAGDCDTGIVFQRTMDDGSLVEFRALSSEVGATDFSTVLGDPRKVCVATVEHILAALSGLGVDNAIVEVSGPEIPILDGSSKEFVEAIDAAGIVSLKEKRRYIRVLQPIRVGNDHAWAEFTPHDGTRFEVDIDFESPAIGRQYFASEITSDVFRNELANARTFGFMKDVERLWAAGYALGASLENSVVIDDNDRVINMGGLRFEDEFVRHKTLDAIGDLALAGARFIGCFRSYRGGHGLNSQVLRKLLRTPEAFEVVETSRKKTGRSAELVAVNAPLYAPWAL